MGSRLGSGRRRRRLNAIGWKLCPSASRDVCLFRAPQCFAILLASGGTSALATSDSSAQTGAARSVRHERIARTHRRDRRSHSKPIPRRHRFGDDAITPSAAGKTVSTRSESRYRFVQIRSRDVTHRDRFAPHEIVLWWSASDSLRSPARQSLATALCDEAVVRLSNAVGHARASGGQRGLFLFELAPAFAYNGTRSYRSASPDSCIPAHRGQAVPLGRGRPANEVPSLRGASGRSRSFP